MGLILLLLKEGPGNRILLDFFLQLCREPTTDGLKIRFCKNILGQKIGVAQCRRQCTWSTGTAVSSSYLEVILQKQFGLKKENDFHFRISWSGDKCETSICLQKWKCRTRFCSNVNCTRITVPLKALVYFEFVCLFITLRKIRPVSFVLLLALLYLLSPTWVWILNDSIFMIRNIE